MHELNHSYEIQTIFEPMTLYKKDWNENRVTKFTKNFNIEHMSFIYIYIYISVIC
jgi:hypothetical protein